ncbi:hypothetical protein Hanom_Chr05g00432251 [Helianthus anomalus]
MLVVFVGWSSAAPGSQRQHPQHSAKEGLLWGLDDYSRQRNGDISSGLGFDSMRCNSGQFRVLVWVESSQRTRFGSATVK